MVEAPFTLLGNEPVTSLFPVGLVIGRSGLLKCAGPQKLLEPPP